MRQRLICRSGVSCDGAEFAKNSLLATQTLTVKLLSTSFIVCRLCQLYSLDLSSPCFRAQQAALFLPNSAEQRAARTERQSGCEALNVRHRQTKTPRRIFLLSGGQTGTTRPRCQHNNASRPDKPANRFSYPAVM